MSCGVCHRCGSDLVLLWLWHRLAAIALIRPLAWEPPYAAGAAQEMAKRQKTKTKQNKTKRVNYMSSHCGAVETNPTRNCEVADSIPGLTQWVKDVALP